MFITNDSPKSKVISLNETACFIDVMVDNQCIISINKEGGHFILHTYSFNQSGLRLYNILQELTELNKVERGK